MKLEHTLHRHGGRVLELLRIEHGTVRLVTGRRSAWWEFIGRVQWDDGSGDGTREVAIAPTCLIVEDEPAGRLEVNRACAALDLYLREHGEWTHDEWRPFERKGSADIGPLIARVDAGED
jgi:hypothetical protein